MKVWVVEVGDKWWDHTEIVGAYTTDVEAHKCVRCMIAVEDWIDDWQVHEISLDMTFNREKRYE